MLVRRIDQALKSVDSSHRREAYIGPLASTGGGGHSAKVNNLYNSEVRGKSVMPFGISSRAMAGTKAQTIVNDNSDNVVVGVYDPARPHVGVGEVCLYSTGGCSIYLSADGVVSVESGGCSLDVEPDRITMNRGNAEITIKSGDIDIKSGDTSIQINSKGGVTIETSKGVGIKATEDVTIETEGNVDVTTTGDIGLTSTGNTTINATGNVDVNASGKVSMTSSGDIEATCPTFKVNGNAEITGSIKASGQTMIVP